MPLAGYSWSVVLVGVATLLFPGECQSTCKGQDGRPGEAGSAGRDGWLGVKGDKGEPAPVSPGANDPQLLLKMKGDFGRQGIQGQLGPKGYAGDLGPIGDPGIPGPQGRTGGAVSQAANPSQQSQSAFSVIRTISTYPAYNQRVTFQSAIVNKPGSHFNINTGEFTCRIPGVYYFVFNAMSKVSMCLRLKSQALENPIGFCDFNNRRSKQVLSGGAVLQLRGGQKVWLEAFKDRQPDSVKNDKNDKQISFNGFLLFESS
ncbi:complement C1q subcomponent subunit A-like [Lampris incognitus]|uniref:complement C1q subcomponent subunit A-like n=1 Tax=Lampris incognitus TaxID=2546036 RepID=UPI0024B4D59A|nr:complement C1q subcomponent subunit A-like [Lampris incognitus]